MPNQTLQKFNLERGGIGEYHVNNTLNRLLGAVRFRNNDQDTSNYYLFDNILIPVKDWAINHTQDFTEIDHILCCKKGIFSIETKSLSGKVFGEKKSQNWYSALAQSDAKQGIYDRIFRNPFKQNSFHVKAISEFLKSHGIHVQIENLVVLVDADKTGWEPGHWEGEPINELFLDAEELTKYISTQPNKISGTKIKEISEKLFMLYQQKERCR